MSSSSSVAPRNRPTSEGGLVGSIKRDFNTMTWVLIPVAIALNMVIGQIVLLLRLPIYLDSIGTMLVGVLCGPWAGALTGLLSNVIWGLVVDNSFLPWFPVAAAIGLTAGLCAKAGLFKSWWKVVIAGFLIAIVAALVSVPISVGVYGGITASGSSFITAYLLETGRGLIPAVFSTNFLVEPVDKIATAMLVFAIIEGLSARYLSRFPRPENVALESQGNRGTQMIIAVGLFIVLILISVFVLVGLLNQQ